MRKDKRRKQYVFVCQGKDCLKNGARSLTKELEKSIKLSSIRSSCQLIKTRCMDRCKEAPSIIVDGAWHGKVGPKDIDEIIKKAAK